MWGSTAGSKFPVGLGLSDEPSVIPKCRRRGSSVACCIRQNFRSLEEFGQSFTGSSRQEHESVRPTVTAPDLQSVEEHWGLATENKKRLTSWAIDNVPCLLRQIPGRLSRQGGSNSRQLQPLRIVDIGPSRQVHHVSLPRMRRFKYGIDVVHDRTTVGNTS